MLYYWATKRGTYEDDLNRTRPKPETTDRIYREMSSCHLDGSNSTQDSAPIFETHFPIDEGESTNRRRLRGDNKDVTSSSAPTDLCINEMDRVSEPETGSNTCLEDVTLTSNDVLVSKQTYR